MKHPLLLLALLSAVPITPMLAASGGDVTTVVQKNRAFDRPRLEIKRGSSVRFRNEDEFLHQIYVSSPKFSFDSNEQAPGQDVDVAFPVAGEFEVICGIHPKMRLDLSVK